MCADIILWRVRYGALGDVQRLDLSSGRWSDLPPLKPVNCHHHQNHQLTILLFLIIIVILTTFTMMMMTRFEPNTGALWWSWWGSPGCSWSAATPGAQGSMTLGLCANIKTIRFFGALWISNSDLWIPVMRKRLLHLWNDFKRGSVCILTNMNQVPCSGPSWRTMGEGGRSQDRTVGSAKRRHYRRQNYRWRWCDDDVNNFASLLESNFSNQTVTLSSV